MKRSSDDAAVIYSSWLDAMHDLEHKGRITRADIGEMLLAIAEYRIDGVIPDFSNPALDIIWLLIKDGVDRQQAKHEAAVRNGSKGGRGKKQTVDTAEDYPEYPLYEES